MKMTLRILLPIFFSLLIFPLTAQLDWKFTHITSDDGLSTGTVNCSLKDSKGFVWIGTADGLNRYDGYNLKVYKNEKNDPSSISGNTINALAEDQNGIIWIATANSGICTFDWETEQFTRIAADQVDGQLVTSAVNAILVDKNNNLIFASASEGIGVYNRTKNQYSIINHQPSDPNSLPSNKVFDIVPDTGDNYWLGLADENYFARININTKKCEKFYYKESLKLLQSSRKPVMKDSRGNLWVGTDGKGAMRYNIASGEFEYFDSNNGLSMEIVTCFYEDEKGNILIGTDGRGINVYDPVSKKFSYIKSSVIDQESLTSDAIYEIKQDESGVVWISTFRGGVNIYSKYRNKFHLWEEIPGEANTISFNSVIALEQSRDGFIWIGTDGGGLDRLDPKTNRFTHYTHSDSDPSSISSNVAIALEEDKNDNLWIGTYNGGVNRFNRRTGRFKRYFPNPDDPNSIGNKNVWAVLEDSRGDIYLGELGGGLSKYVPSIDGFRRFAQSPEKGSISSDFVVTLLEDSQGNFWVGTQNDGLNLFDRDKGTFKVFKHDAEDSTSLLHNNVPTLFEDTKGNLWIGSVQGLCVMNIRTKSIRRVTDYNIATSNASVNGIKEDAKGNLWISTNKGLNKYNPSTKELIQFSNEDGLQGTQFNYNSSIKTQSGRMYFGGIKGLNDFHPDEVTLSQYNPNIEITDVRIFNESISSYKKKNGKRLIEGSIVNLDELTLTYDQNVLAFEFTALDFTSPMSNEYRYKLEGFNEDWIYTTAKDRQARYTNLDPDEYLLRIQGTNSDGKWSDKERQLTLIVLPPWWSTWWFRALVIIAILALAVSITIWRQKQIRLQRQILQDKVDEATSQVLERNKSLQTQQDALKGAIEDTNYVIKEAVESGNFSARIDVESKEGEWRALGESINRLFDSILTPFDAINAVINSMADSDLSDRYHGEAKGDVKRVTDNLNTALDNLSELLEEIINQTESIRSSSDEMLVTSEEMNVSTKEIASSIAEMSRGAQNQVQRIDEASNILEGILRFSTEVGDQAESINAAAERGVDQSDKGKDLIARVDNSMKRILSVSDETNKAIGILSNRSEEISRVLNIIKEIAGQTNLLALNAAIEAAKAGESGRGFSVVAEQIRKLAEDSGNSTKDIEEMVSEVQSAIKVTAQHITEMSQNIEGGVEASQHASVSFEELAASYSQTLRLSERIVGATRQQTQDVSKVVQLMEGVVVISEQTASGTEEIASSSSELSSGMSEYSKKTKDVSEIVERLKLKLNQFRLHKES